MNLEQLQGFLAVANTGHFTRAAAQLHLAQPTLSRQISTLETELGSELFHRARGNITLTAAGETLLPVATRMLADAEHIRYQMQQLRGLHSGRVRLGAPPTLCVSLVAEVLEKFHAAYPGVDLVLHESGSHGLLEDLATGMLDLALVVTSEHEPAPTQSLEHLPLFTEELLVISSKRTPGGQPGQQLALDELAGLPQIAFSHSYDLRAATMQAYRQHNLTPHIVLDGGEMDAVLRFVERGLGVAVVPAMVLLDRPGLSTSRLVQPALSRTISLAHRKDVHPTRAAAAMQQMLRSTVADLAAGNPAIRSLL
ncbi:LysR family transcriptional regulator [Glutamicibacter sp. MNS18]|uniref:LysR family transcriptional regulator n=1 Tax=Glutamicibacter sp. MNS18 TaxID=2989817 RepID=UPI0022356FDD|nr:LysR family transcriptional regulator [Glutamicibacter sp. MNS18]MCW4465612.1 LysR family transcriptional regulator [Glutamicibacter sp. MNS18]